MAFPIKVNGEAVNVVQAIWAKEKTAVTEEQYDDFYRFIANTYDKPIYRCVIRCVYVVLRCAWNVYTFIALRIVLSPYACYSVPSKGDLLVILFFIHIDFTSVRTRRSS